MKTSYLAYFSKLFLCFSIVFSGFTCFSAPDTLYVDANISMPGDGQTWVTAVRRIQDAIDILGGELCCKRVICVKEGVYPSDGSIVPIVSLGGFEDVNIYGGFPDIPEPTFADRNPKLYRTILDGQGNTRSIFSINGVGVPGNKRIFLDGLVLTKNNANTDTEKAAIVLESNSGTFNLNVSNCVFEDNNSANQDASVVYTMGVGSKAEFVNCLFKNISGSPGQTSFSKSRANSEPNSFINCTFHNIKNHGSIFWRLGGVSSGDIVRNCVFDSSIDLPFTSTGDAPFVFESNVIDKPGINDDSDITTEMNGASVQDNVFGPIVYSGSDPDFTLDISSTGFDKGSNIAFTNSDYFSITSSLNDINGNSRIFGGSIDMGAFENQTCTTPLLVTTNADSPSPTCGMLRFALNHAINNPGPDEITFSNDMIGQVIRPTSQLPLISGTNAIGTVVKGDIDGDNIPDVEIDGNGASANGVVIEANDCEVQFLSIYGFTNAGVLVNKLTSPAVTGVKVLGNYLGTNIAGNPSTTGNAIGVRVLNNSDGVQIGDGTSPGRNHIAGNTGQDIFISNASNASVLGNFIGTNRTGDGPYGGASTSVNLLLSQNSSGCVIGGVSLNQANLIANTEIGIQFFNVTNCQVIGNYIGVSEDSISMLTNTGETGIYISNGTSNTISKNVFGFHDNEAILLKETTANTTVDNEILENIFVNKGLNEQIVFETAGIQGGVTKPTFNVDIVGTDLFLSGIKGAGDIVQIYLDSTGQGLNYVDRESGGATNWTYTIPIASIPEGFGQLSVLVNQGSNTSVFSDPELFCSNPFLITLQTDDNPTGGGVCGELRYAIEQSNNSSLIENITVDPSVTEILLNSGLQITSPVNINGNNVRLSHAPSFPSQAVLSLDSSNINISNLEITSIGGVDFGIFIEGDNSKDHSLSSIVVHGFDIAGVANEDPVNATGITITDSYFYNNDRVGVYAGNNWNVSGSTFGLDQTDIPAGFQERGLVVSDSSEIGSVFNPNTYDNNERAGLVILGSNNTVQYDRFGLFTGPNSVTQEIGVFIGNDLGLTNSQTSNTIDNCFFGSKQLVGIRLDTVTDVLIDNCSIVGSGGGAGEIDSVGIILNNTSNSRIVNSQISRQFRQGIIIGNRSEMVDLENNTISENQFAGILILTGARNINVGGSDISKANVITENGTRGVRISGTDTRDNYVQYNYIGTDNLENDLGNTLNGVHVSDGSIGNLIRGNIIAYNKEYGLFFDGNTQQNTVSFDEPNSIFNNTSGGININDALSHAGIQAPVITSWDGDSLKGSFNDLAGVDSRVITIYADEGNQGKQYLTHSSTDFTTNNWAIKVDPSTITVGLDSLTALLTLFQTGVASYSEFSEPIPAAACNPLVVKSSADDGTCGTLRGAVEHLNNIGGNDTIRFDLSLMTDSTVNLVAPLPEIVVDRVVILGDIDGDKTPDVFINSSLIPGASGVGLIVKSNDCVVNGLMINGKGNSTAIRINGSRNIVEYNFIGIKKDGTSVPSTPAFGIHVYEPVSLTNVEDNVIRGNVLVNCGSTGSNLPGAIYVQYADRTLITENVIGEYNGVAMPNQMNGVAINNGQDNYVFGNKIVNSVLNGILLGDNSTNSILRTKIGSTTLDSANVIGSNAENGILITGVGSNNHVVRNNYIGTDASSSNLGNGQAGIKFSNQASFNQVYESTIGFNNEGVVIEPGIAPVGPVSILISDCFIGVDASGNDIGNLSHGYRTTRGSQETIQSSKVAFNGGYGIVYFAQTSRNAHGSTNEIYANALGGIHIANEGLTTGNGMISKPNILGFNGTTVSGTYVPSKNPSDNTWFISVYADDSTQGRLYLGQVTDQSSGDWSFDLTPAQLAELSSLGLDSFTVIQTDTLNPFSDTYSSEFSEPFSAIFCNPLLVRSIEDTDACGTLRGAVKFANTENTDDTIFFDPSMANQTITLNSVLTIEDNGILIVNPEGPDKVDDLTILSSPGISPELIVAEGQVGINGLNFDLGGNSAHLLLQKEGSVFSNNSVFNGSADGLIIQGRAKVFGNKFDDITANALELDGADESEIFNNGFGEVDPVGTAIHLNGSRNTTIGGKADVAPLQDSINVILNTTTHAIILNNAPDNVVLGNLIGLSLTEQGVIDNLGSGVLMNGSGQTSGNIIGGNIISNAFAGVRSEFSSNNILIGNEIRSNRTVGIQHGGGNENTFSKNKVYDNDQKPQINITNLNVVKAFPPNAISLRSLDSTVVFAYVGGASAEVQQNDKVEVFVSNNGARLYLGDALLDASKQAEFKITQAILDSFSVAGVTGDKYLVSTLTKSNMTAPFFRATSELSDSVFIDLCNPFIVDKTTDEDNVCGTLRNAIIKANEAGGNQEIRFDLTAMGSNEIVLTSPLPAITTNNVVINGLVDADTIPDVVLSGDVSGISGANPDNAITIQGDNNTIQGLAIKVNLRTSGNPFQIDVDGDNNTIIHNFIDLEIDGLTDGPWSLGGLFVSGEMNNVVGNIFGTGSQPLLLDGANNTLILYNQATLGGGSGALFTLVSSSNNIIKNNVLANSAGSAISLQASSTNSVKNTVLGGSIYGSTNATAISIGDQNELIGRAQAPVMTANNIVEGISNGIRGTGTPVVTLKPRALVQLYADAGGEGQFFIDSTRSNDLGEWLLTFDPASIPTGLGNLVITITDELGNTSGFSDPIENNFCNPLLVTKTIDDGSCGTLRNAVEVASQAGAFQEITFALNNDTIKLESTLLIPEVADIYINATPSDNIVVSPSSSFSPEVFTGVLAGKSVLVNIQGSAPVTGLIFDNGDYTNSVTSNTVAILHNDNGAGSKGNLDNVIIKGFGIGVFLQSSDHGIEFSEFYANGKAIWVEGDINNLRVELNTFHGIAGVAHEGIYYFGSAIPFIGQSFSLNIINNRFYDFSESHGVTNLGAFTKNLLVENNTFGIDGMGVIKPVALPINIGNIENALVRNNTIFGGSYGINLTDNLTNVLADSNTIRDGLDGIRFSNPVPNQSFNLSENLFSNLTGTPIINSTADSYIPVITNVDVVAGEVSGDFVSGGSPGMNYKIELFATSTGQADVFVGSQEFTTGGNTWVVSGIDFNLIPAQYTELTATATFAENTSPLSLPVLFNECVLDVNLEPNLDLCGTDTTLAELVETGTEKTRWFLSDTTSTELDSTAQVSTYGNGEFIVAVGSGGCIVLDTVSISITEEPTVTVSNLTGIETVCSGDLSLGLTITPSPGASFSWIAIGTNASVPTNSGVGNIPSEVVSLDGGLVPTGDISYEITPILGSCSGDEVLYSIVVIPPCTVDPVVVDDVVSTNENVAVEIDLTGNDNFTQVVTNSIVLDSIMSSTLIPNESTTFNGAIVAPTATFGVFNYIPANGFVGVDKFKYNLFDGVTLLGSATVTVTVNPVLGSDPVAFDDSETSDQGVVVFIQINANDTDTDNDIDPSSIDLDPNTVGKQNTLSTPEGSWTVDNSGLLTFGPDATYIGDAVINYTISDLAGNQSNIATITVTVVPIGCPVITISKPSLGICDGDVVLTAESIGDISRYEFHWAFGTPGNRIANATDDTYRAIIEGDYFVNYVDPDDASCSGTVQDNVEFGRSIPNISNTNSLLNANSEIDATAFQWFVEVNGEKRAIVGATFEDYNALFSGRYYVKVDYSNNCVLISDGLDVTTVNGDVFKAGLTMTGDEIYIPESLATLSVLPNPSEGEFMASFASYNSELLEVSLLNAQGLQLFKNTQAKTSFKTPIYLGDLDLDSGVYFLLVTQGSEQYMERVQVVR